MKLFAMSGVLFTRVKKGKACKRLNSPFTGLPEHVLFVVHAHKSEQVFWSIVSLAGLLAEVPEKETLVVPSSPQ